MWTIPKPALSALEMFDTCVAGIRAVDLKARLTAIRPAIVTAEAEYDTAATAGDLHLVPTSAQVGGMVSAGEMTALYDRHMAREKSRGRSHYDELMLAAADDICPFCGQRQVSTLDHCLPKSDHPALAVTPINLVPCCKDCNFDKGTLAVASKEDQLLNAYYDDVTADVWLRAEIIQGNPAGVRYWAEPPEAWDAVLRVRVINHFEKLSLAKLYASQGGRQLRNMRRAMRTFHSAGGPQAVRDDLVRCHESCTEVTANSWLGALYLAAVQSDWFCSGGFDAA